MSEGRLARRSWVRLLPSLLAVGLVAAAVLSFGSGAALASSTSYTCTGTISDEAAVNAAINSYDSVTILGPRACYGNFYAHSNDVTIRGQAARQQQAVFYGSGTSQNGTVLTVDSGITVTLVSMEITHGDNTSGGGGGIYASGDATVVLNKSTVAENITENGQDGGGIDLWGATLWASSSSITDNTADGSGGGVMAANSSPVHLSDGTTVSGNTSNGGVAGGIGLDSYGSNPGWLDHTTVTGNTAHDSGGGSYGGGINANQNPLTVTNSTITWNQANGDTGYGGGIFVKAADVSLAGTTVSHNSASYRGGGIWNEGHSPIMCTSLTNSTVTFNTAGSDGGGIGNSSYGGSSLFEITNSTVSQNTATNGNGGGIANIGDSGDTANLSINSSTLSGNKAVNGYGGAIANFLAQGGSTAAVTVGHTHINRNQAEYGGGISNDDSYGTATVSLQTDAFVSRNTATIDGGGVWTTALGEITIAPSANVSHNAPTGDDVS
jgi:hypothetical protein